MNQASRANSASVGAPAITDLGHDVFQIDTKMAGYEGVTAGYLTHIHLDHAGGTGDMAEHHVGLLDSATGDLYVGDAAGVYLPETGDLRAATPPPDFDLEQALGSVRMFGTLQPTRLLFSHYGPVDDVDTTLARSAEEIMVWVEETRRARGATQDLDHPVAMVAERTRQRYVALRDDSEPVAAAKLDRLTATAANVAGIVRWLDKTGPLNT